MPTSVREQLIAAILTAVNGQYTASVPRDDDELPLCIVQDGEEQASADDYGHMHMIMPVAIAKASVIASIGLDAQRQECHELLASIITDMHADETFGGLADGIDYTGGGVLAEPGNRCMAEAQFDVRYHTVRGDPYTIDEE